MCLKIILKVKKKQGFNLSLENTFFKKLQGAGGQIAPLLLSHFRVKDFLS